ncbi:Centaurin-gamma-1A [Frankliniella fusca]|uniref:Centaurin-gamma-1A n=1 Tax=Frankliniella fusca TaxID=407009 RepID=A0AAE1GZG0_9NEOP|nr:Centaurin-gamma-1A [Frankliniella fusca]
MNSRSHLQSFNNSIAIRQEIQRFESVHPSIYAIYDLIELVPDQLIAQQIRDHVVCIEDALPPLDNCINGNKQLDKIHI